MGRAVVLLALLLASIGTEPLEKSYQNGLLAHGEWDLNHDCIVPYEEFKSWVLDMLMSVIKFQALVEAEHPGSEVFEEATYESLMRRVIERLNRLSYQNANITKIMDRFFTKLVNKLEDEHVYNNTATLARIFKFNSRLNLTFWYNL